MLKILRIDVGAAGGPVAKDVPVGEYAGLGGRALTSTLVAKEVPPLCHPLGAENKLVIAPGIFSGTIARHVRAVFHRCKSPLTGGIKEVQLPADRPPRSWPDSVTPPSSSRESRKRRPLQGLHQKDGVKITRDNSLKMLPNYDLVEKMKAEFGNDKLALSPSAPPEK